MLSGHEELVFFAHTISSTYALLLVPFFALACAEMEEKHRTLGFLRTLPVSPGRIVGATYLAVLVHGILVVLVLTVLARLAAVLAPPGARLAAAPDIHLAAALTLPAAGLTLAVFYRAGLREARIALLSAFALFYLAPVVLADKVGFMRFMNAFFAGASIRSGATILLIALSLILYTAEYAAAAWFFARREFS